MEVFVVLEDPNFQLVLHKRIHVNMRNLDKDFKCHKMDDAMLNCVLVSQHVDVEELGGQIY
jgi:hypothetical protein